MAIAQSIQDFLEQNGVSYETVAHPKTYSAHDTATAAHIDDAHIAKAVVLKDEQGYLLAVIPASRKLDLDRVQTELGRKMELAPEDEADRLFQDCLPGAFPPIGRAYGLETILDESLTSLAKIYFEAGDHEHLIVVGNDPFLALMKGLRHGYFSKFD